MAWLSSGGTGVGTSPTLGLPGFCAPLHTAREANQLEYVTSVKAICRVEVDRSVRLEQHQAPLLPARHGLSADIFVLGVGCLIFLHRPAFTNLFLVGRSGLLGDPDVLIWHPAHPGL